MIEPDTASMLASAVTSLVNAATSRTGNGPLPATQNSYRQNNLAKHGGQAFGIQRPDSRILVHQAPPAPHA